MLYQKCDAVLNGSNCPHSGRGSLTDPRYVMIKRVFHNETVSVHMLLVSAAATEKTFLHTG